MMTDSEVNSADAAEWSRPYLRAIFRHSLKERCEILEE
ncbi:hypothetical protein NPIL_618321, partial [Nephila pilipes]